jgi:integrase
MSATGQPDPDDPFQWILDNYYDTKSTRTKEAIEDVLFDGNVALEPWLKEHGLSPREITRNHAKEYFKDIKEEYAASTQNEYARKVTFVYSKLLSRGVKGIETNPFEPVYEQEDIIEEDIPDNTIIYDKSVLQEILSNHHPCYFTMSLTMVKTTRRIGGTVNLDLCDVHLDHPAADWNLDPHIRDYPDHIYYSPKPEQDKEFRGEIRKSSAKTETHTLIPIDDELKEALIWWIMMRRGTREGGPLFTKPSAATPKQRVTDGEYREELNQVAGDLGYRYEGHDPGNIRPHYWRHWSTSVMRDRIPRATVDYFRGDVGNTGDGYNHYTSEKAEQWLNNVPKFL